MIVKIGNHIYDSSKEPIMLILSSEDKKNIADMHPDAQKLVSYPSSFSDEEIVKFMDIEESIS